MAGSKLINFRDVLEDWVVNRNQNALSKLNVYIEPLARKAAGMYKLPRYLQDEFACYVMTWLYERSESAYRRGVSTDTLSKVYQELCSAIENDAASEKDLSSRQDTFSKIVIHAFTSYALPDFWRSLERAGEVPRRTSQKKTSNSDKAQETGIEEKASSSRTRIPKPIFISLENWQANNHEIDLIDTCDEDGELVASFQDWELIPLADVEDQKQNDRITVLKKHVAEQKHATRVTVRLRYYSLLEELTGEDVAYIVQMQRKIPQPERVLDLSADPDTMKDSLVKKLQDPAVITARSETDYAFIASLLACSPGLANTRVFRCIRDLRTKRA